MELTFRIMRFFGAGCGAAAILLAGCATLQATRLTNILLTGAEQVPPVMTAATGTALFIVYEDRRVEGSVDVIGISPTMAHIHVGARGANGPVAINLTRISDTKWEVAAGAKFTEEQYKAFLAGQTYVNFHTAANKGGEIRAQLQR